MRVLFPVVLLIFGFSQYAQAEPKDLPGVDSGPPPAFDKLDIDDDKLISREESKLERQLFLHFDAFDTDSTNRLSPREYEKYKSY